MPQDHRAVQARGHLCDWPSQLPLAPVSSPLLPTPQVSRKDQTPNLGLSGAEPCTLPRLGCSLLLPLPIHLTSRGLSRHPLWEEGWQQSGQVSQ